MQREQETEEEMASGAPPAIAASFVYRGDGDRKAVPRSVLELIVGLQEEEARETAACQKQLDEAWAAVERCIARVDRRKQLIEKMIADGPTTFKTYEFWTQETLRKHFDLTSIAEDLISKAASGKPVVAATGADGQETVSAEEAQREEEMLEELAAKEAAADPIQSIPLTAKGRPGAVLPPMASRSEVRRSLLEKRASGKPETPSAPEATTSTTTTTTSSYAPVKPKEPKQQYVPHPLRRCLAPVLRKRATVGPEFTLLLNAIAACQKRLEPIETSMMKSKFQLPVDVPFRKLAQYINNVVFSRCAATSVERRCEDELLPPMKAATALLQSIDDRKVPVPDGPTFGANGNLLSHDAKAAYETLQQESKQREAIFIKGFAILKDAHSYESTLRGALLKGQEDVLRSCREALDYVRDKAAKVTQSSMAVINQLERVHGEGTEAFTEPMAACDKELASLQFKLAKNDSNQEKILRKLRESYKELRKEQAEHEALTTAYCNKVVEHQRLEESKHQFEKSCEQRRESLKDAYDACVFLTDIISNVSTEVEFVIEQCRLHVSRCLTDESFRKARIAKIPIENARQWFRCVGDMMMIKQTRNEVMQRRMTESWQLEFLLSSEKKNVDDALVELKAYQKHVLAEWGSFARLLDHVDNLVVPILHHIDKEPSVVNRRERFAILVGGGPASSTDTAAQSVVKQIETDTMPPTSTKAEVIAAYKTSRAAGISHAVEEDRPVTAGAAAAASTPEVLALPPVPPRRGQTPMTAAQPVDRPRQRPQPIGDEPEEYFPPPPPPPARKIAATM